jgi:chemotaxis protein MotB
VGARLGLGIAAVAVAIGVLGGAYAWRLHARVLPQVEADAITANERAAVCERARAEERQATEQAGLATAALMDESRAELEELRAEHAESEKRLEAFKALTEQFRKMIDSGKLEVVLRHGRMVVKLPAGVLFDSGSAELSKDGKGALREVAAILNRVKGRRFMVAGHTDNVPVVASSPFKNNLELSTARALTVAQHLVASGMNPARLVAAGYSQYEPVQPNTREAGRRENRRIEIVLMPNVTEIPELPGEGRDAGAPDAGGPAAR